jgi:hypothetical protein
MQSIHRSLEAIESASIWYHQIRGCQPFGSSWLRSHARANVSFGLTPSYGAMEADGVRGIDDHPAPGRIEGLAEQGHLNNHWAGRNLHPIQYLFEDIGMGQFLQSPQLIKTVEHNPSEEGSVYRSVDNDVGPFGRYDFDRGSAVGENRMADRIGVDGGHPPDFEHLAHGRLSRPDAARKKPSPMPGAHSGAQ